MSRAQATQSIESVVRRIVQGTRGQPGDLIPILQQIQAEYRYLPEEAVRQVAKQLGLSAATVYGVATFYAQFSLEPKGKWIIRVCDGTACHVRGSQSILDALKKKLDLADGAITTSDRRFTLETVSCLGACGLAPVVVVADDVHGQVTPEAMELILEHLLEEEGSVAESEVAVQEVRQQ